MVVADCAGATVRAVGGRSATVGETVTLTTRPERLGFADTPQCATRQNRLAGTIAETVFVGERCRYLCHCAGGVSIVLKEPSSATVRRRVRR